MAQVFIDEDDIKGLYNEAESDARQWQEDYPSYERLAENGLMEGLDPNLPEVNDGSLAAALFKLPKRVVSNDLSGRVKALNRDEAWITELANMQLENEIIPNANTQAPFHRKWKDAVRKSAIYGSVPIISLFVERGDYTGGDFIVAQPQDVRMESGKISDYDSDIFFWDVYYSKSQLQNIIEEAKAEDKEAAESDGESYNKWKVSELEEILKSNQIEEKDPKDTNDSNKTIRQKGFKFCVVFQRGINAPFYMYYSKTNKAVREWTNPDPTGDVPIHYLYCYQDFVNPYGIGIVKLAGGTQNVLDYLRQADILATQIGIRPPWMIGGDADSADLDSFVYTQDGMIFTGNAEVERMTLDSGIYQQLPGRMSQYQASLQKLIPTGDTSISGQDSGDSTMSKTPAGVKLAAANLSIDDDDYKDNLYMTYAAVMKSVVNIHFANMQGTDLMKLSDDERNILEKAGLEFPANEEGDQSNELEIEWDTTRAQFNFEVDPESDKAKDEEKRLEGLTRVLELTMTDPTLEQSLMESGYKFNKGELIAELIQLTTDNDKIITEITPEEQEMNQKQQAMLAQGQQEPIEGEVVEPGMEQQGEMMPQESMEMPMDEQMESPAYQEQEGSMEQQMPIDDMDEEMRANVDAIAQEYGVDENTALAALSAEAQGLPIEEIMATLQQYAEEGRALND